jgi:hypothetical protein
MTKARSRAGVFLVLASVAMGPAACDDGDEIGIPDGGLLDDGGMTADSASVPAVVDCSQIAQGFCDVVSRCLKGWIETAFGDIATCAGRLRLACEDAKAAPGSTLTAAAQNSCLQGLAAASCADVIDRKFTGCDIPGTRVDGMGCAHNGQCASNLCRSSETLCGACGPKAAAGGACTEDEECTTGLVCPEVDGTRRCVARAPAGMACSRTQPCAYGFACDGNLCVAAGKAGATCRRPGGDLVGTCDGTQYLFCGSGNVCQVIPTASAGQPCGVIGNGYVGCAGGTYCRTNALSFTGVCANTAADGTACGPLPAGPPCVAPATCVDGLCRLPSALQCQ